MTSAAWNAALDRIEAELTAIDDAIANGLPAPAQSGTTFPSEPMPPDLGPRADALLQRTRGLETRAAEELEGIGDALRALAGRRPPAPTNTGQIVDVGA
jgi:hypothetical protein